jgi:hypothetical protein
MTITWGGAAGFAAVLAVFVAAVGWLSTRKLFYGRFRSSPYSALRSGWRSSFRLIRAFPYVALGLFAAKLLQATANNFQNIYLMRPHRMEAWGLTGLVIDLVFQLAWAALVLRIGFFILRPELEDKDRRRRTRRAVLYALAFWGLTIVVDIAGILLVLLVRGADHGIVIRSVGYIFIGIATVSALARPAIAVGLPKPLTECWRIIRDNWFGALVTLILGVLPFALVFYVVNVLAHMLRMGLLTALLIQIPISAASALCYLAFEGVIAAMYKRIM